MPAWFSQAGIAVTATEPDVAMLAEMRKHLPANVTTVQAAFEDLPLDSSYQLVYSAAALHWTNPEGRWARMAALVQPGGVFASFGVPIQLADPALKEAVRAARAPYLENDGVPSPVGTPADRPMQWPGTELQQSETTPAQPADTPAVHLESAGHHGQLRVSRKGGGA